MHVLAAWARRWTSRNSRLTSTMVSPRHVMRTRASSVTSAMGVASRFSSCASAMNASTSSARQRHGHALLALGDGELGAVEAVVLLGHAIQVDEQAVGQLAHGHRHAARAEVVAALDHAARVAATEQALHLALDRRIALLHLGAAALERLQRCAPSTSPSRRRCRRGPCARPEARSRRPEPASRAARGRRAWRPPRRRSPCAWPRSRDGTARSPGPLPGRSGCRSDE